MNKLPVALAIGGSAALLVIVAVSISNGRPDDVRQESESSVQSALSIIQDKTATEDDVVDAIRELDSAKESASLWGRIAADSAYSTRHRQHAVFQLFACHVRIGTTLGNLAEKLDGAQWLGEHDIERPRFLSGAWSFDPTDNGSVFRLNVLSTGPPYWVIWLDVSQDIEEQDMIDLIQGKKVRQQVKDALILHMMFSPTLEAVYRKEGKDRHAGIGTKR